MSRATAGDKLTFIYEVGVNRVLVFPVYHIPMTFHSRHTDFPKTPPNI